MEAIHVAETERSVSSHALDAQARGRMYALLAGFCNYRPDKSLVQGLRASDLRALLADEASAPIRAGLQAIASYLRDSHNESDEALSLELAQDWTRLFRGVRPGYGPPPPYEAVYSPGENEIYTLRAVARSYDQAGAAPSEVLNERPDYVGIELEFLRYLADREAQAWLQDDAEAALALSEAARDFLNTHLARWLPSYCDQAAGHAGTAFYRGAIQLLNALTTPDFIAVVI